MEINPGGPFSGVLFGILYGIKYQDLVIPVCFFVWSFILFASLAGIELSDGITAATFVTFAVFSAAIIVLAIPRKLISTEEPIRIVYILFTAGGMAVAKWLFAFRRTAQRLRIEQEIKRSNARGQTGK